MDRLVEIVEEMRANYVTRAYLVEVVSHLATKQDLARYVTQDDLKELAEQLAAKFATREEVQILAAKMDVRFAEITEAMRHFATKEELQRDIQNLRSWVIGIGVTLFFSFAGLQVAMFQLLLHMR